MFDFILPNKERELFSKFDYSDTVIMSLQEYRCLKKFKLVGNTFNNSIPWLEKNIPDVGTVTISPKGMQYREYINSLQSIQKLPPLSRYDAVIFDYVKKHNSAERSQIKGVFGETGLYRFDCMAKAKLFTPDTATDDYGNTVNGNNYSVTPLGNSYRQEYCESRCHYWFPIIVDFILSLIAIAISLVALFH